MPRFRRLSASTQMSADTGSRPARVPTSGVFWLV